MNLQGGGGGILVWIRSLPADTAPRRRGRQEEGRPERDGKQWLLELIHIHS